MIIGIEGHRLYRERKFGMDIVALELIKHLQIIDKENEYVIFVRPNIDNTCIPHAPNFRIVEINSSIYPFWEQLELPKIALREGCDVLHCSSNTAPLFCKVPVITTLHDIIFLEKDYLFSKSATLYQRFGNMYRRLIVDKVVKNSQIIVTVSEFEKQQIRNVFGINECCLRVIYNGVSEHFRTEKNESEKQQLRLKYNLPENFILFMGNTDPKKNTLNTLRGFAEYKQNNSSDTQLVMLNFSKKELRKSLKYIGCEALAKDIVLTGYMHNSEIPGIMQMSKAFLYTSTRESFGIPMLEGMCSHVPVIASNVSAMPEVAGDAALLVDPFCPKSIASGIATVMQNEEIREVLIAKGNKRSEHFSWIKMAQQYLQLYNEFAKI